MLQTNLAWTITCVLAMGGYLCRVQCSEAQRGWHLEQAVGVNGGACSSENVVFSFTDQSSISCATICLTDDTCDSFQYDTDQKTCVGCRVGCQDTRNAEPGESPGLTCWKEKTNETVSTPTDCLDVAQTNESATDGVYPITTRAGTSTEVYCEMLKRDGGWTVFLRRFDGTVHFNQTFRSYEEGFGSKTGEHWLGLELIREMTVDTESDICVLSVGGLFHVTEGVEEWEDFYIGPAPDYRMNIDDGCLLNATRGQKFSSSANEATWASHEEGRGWYSSNCDSLNPTGKYSPFPKWDRKYMFNQPFLGHLSLQEMTLMFRRRT